MCTCVTARQDLVQRFSAEALASLDLREWSGLVQSIFETYVLPDAEELINISSDTSRSMVLAFEDFQGSSGRFPYSLPSPRLGTSGD